MKKHGFTLVELLAVIAILALLVIIALPNIMSLFNEAKKNSFTNEVKQIHKSALQQWMSDSMFDTNEMVYARTSSGDCTKSLKLSGRGEIHYYVKLNKLGNITELYAEDGTYQYSYEGDGLKVEDIDEVVQISKLNEDDIISIPCSKPAKIKVCKLKRTGELTATKEYVTCEANQTIKECLNLTSYVNLYKTDESNPGEEDLFGCYLRINGSTNAPSGSMINTLNVRCSQNTQYYTRYSVNETVLPSSSGCYSYIIMICLDGDTLIEVYDKKKKKKLKKKLKDITYDDLVLSWDFDKGEYVYAKVFWIMKPTLADSSILLKFDNETELKVVKDHRIFDYDNNTFISCLKAKKGLRTITSDGTIVTLVSKRIIKEDIYAYNLITEKHINVFAGGILTSQGSNNIYNFKNMKFDKVKRERFTDDDLKEISKEYIEALRLDEWIVDEKENKEKTLIDLKNYINHLKNTKL